MTTSRPSVPPKPWYLALHVEAFSAQVIASWSPALQGVPFVVLKQMRNGHKTLVHACSQEAVALGAEPGMPLPVLERRFPKMKQVERNKQEEKIAQEDLARVLNSFSPVSTLKEGCAVLDLTGTPVMREQKPEKAVEVLRRRIQEELGFRQISIGLAGTKIAAQVLSRKARPDRVLMAQSEKSHLALFDLSPSCLPHLSPGCRARIQQYAITTIGQLYRLGRETLVLHFGKEGEKLYAMVSGLDVPEASESEDLFLAETVLQRDVNDTDLLHRFVRLTVDNLVFQMRKADKTTSRFTVEIEYADHKSSRRSFTMDETTQAFTVIAKHALQNFDALLTRRVALKAIRLFAKQARQDKGQLNLFRDAQEERQEALGRALDRIRSKHAFNAVLSAAHVRLS